MKTHLTQKLFWKKWPYKATIEVSVAQSLLKFKFGIRQSVLAELVQIKIWIKDHFPTAGTRIENSCNVFLHTQEELDEVLAVWGSRVTAIWQPESDSAVKLMQASKFDIVRSSLWYNKYPIRARVLFDNKLTATGVATLRDALLNVDDWHCAGTLYRIIMGGPGMMRAWAPPMHLYLHSDEDAAILQLYCGNLIDRFERILIPSKS